MTTEKLESNLDNALVNLSQKIKDTTNELISENAPMSKIINSVYDNVFECLDKFKSAIVDYENDKS